MKKIVSAVIFLCIVATATFGQIGSYSQRGMATAELRAEGMAALHPSLPINSKVWVTNVANGKVVEVIITGRVPSSASRIIDLSPAAAAALDLGSGGQVSISSSPPQQAATPPPPPNPSIAGEAMLKRAISTNPTNSWDTAKQKGQWISGNQNLSACLYASGKMYFGYFLGGKKHGYGIYIVPEGYTIGNCPNAKYYVGNWSNDEMSGTGTCYNASGTLIYYGEFKADKPTGTYPTTGNYSTYKFQTIDYTSGDKYIGETNNGKRDGYGVYAWKDGRIWIGYWKDGVRSGQGIDIASNGTLLTGTWNKDTRTAAPSVASNSSGSSSSGSSSSGSSGGYSLSTMRCIPCYGTGRNSCVICSGTGRTMVGYQYVLCFMCSGMGSKLCTICNGAGQVTLSPPPTLPVVPVTPITPSYSSGSGSGSSGSSSNGTPCSTCKSTGLCQTCKGSGEIIDPNVGMYTGRSITEKYNCGVCKGSGKCGVCYGRGSIR